MATRLAHRSAAPTDGAPAAPHPPPRVRPLRVLAERTVQAIGAIAVLLGAFLQWGDEAAEVRVLGWDTTVGDAWAGWAAIAGAGGSLLLALAFASIAHRRFRGEQEVSVTTVVTAMVAAVALVTAAMIVGLSVP